MRRALAAAVLAWGVTAPAALAEQTVQPGMLVNVAGTQCTGGFVYDGTGALGGRHYLGLAAHCVETAIGSPATDADGQAFGKVAFSAWPYETYADDYAFVEIDQSAYARVSPAMAGHPDLPSGVVPAGGGAAGDRVQFSGWGFVTAARQETREQRVAFLKSHNERLWFAWGVVSNTDSGGPVAHLPTGAALGSVSNYCLPLPLSQSDGFEPGCTAWGPSVARIIAAAAQRGFTVDLRTVAEGRPTVPRPPVPPPPPPPPPPAGDPTAAPTKPASQRRKKKKTSRKPQCKRTKKRKPSRRCRSGRRR